MNEAVKLLLTQARSIDDTYNLVRLLVELFELNDNITTEDRRKSTVDLSKIFVTLVTKISSITEIKEKLEELARIGSNNGSKIQVNSIEEFNEKVEKFIQSVTAGLHEVENDTEASIAFAFFLKKIIRTSDNETRELAIEQYQKFSDLIEEAKWIFTLKNKKNETIFKVSGILDSAIKNFKINSGNVLKIAFALQLFNVIKSVDNTLSEDESKCHILEIANEYNIEILKFLCDGGELLLGKPLVLNYKHNGVFICKKANEILIRSENKHYFNGANDIQEEKSNNDEAIAFFVVKKLDISSELMSFSEALTTLTNNEKIKLIKHIFSNKYFNIFVGKQLIINTISNTFIDALNPYCKYDEYIIGAETVKNNTTAFFFEILCKDYKYLRRQIICKKNNFDLLALDFVVQLLQDKSSEDCFQIMDRFSQKVTEGDMFLQNLLVESFFEVNISDINATVANLISYWNFISKCLPINEISKTTHHTNDNTYIVYPFKLYTPFDNINDLIKKYFNAADLNYGLVHSRISKGTKTFFVNEVNIEKYTFEEEDINIEDLEEKYILYHTTTQKIYIIQEFEKAISAVQKIRQYKDALLIDVNMISAKEEKLLKIVKIMNNIGIAHNVFNIFDIDKEYYNDNNLSVEKLKLLWHIQIMEFKENKLDLFIKLVLECHNCDYVLESDEIYKNYFKNVLEKSENERCIIISKCEAHDVSTFKVLKSRYCHDARNIFSLLETKQGIEKQIEKQKRRGEIETIYFLTDNIMSGGSTVKMLEFYLIDGSGDNHRSFIQGISEMLKTIISSNKNVKIVVMPIFCRDNSESLIKSKFKSSNIKIETSNYIVSNNFSSEKCKTIAKDIYSDDDIEMKRKFTCFFRPINMAAMSIFPEFVCNTKNIIGLFTKRNEYQ